MKISVVQLVLKLFVQNVEISGRDDSGIGSKQ